MPERQHRLPSNYERLDEQITGPVLDSIVVAARSHGRLHLPGEYSTANRPPRHEVSITSTDKNNSAVYREERLLGDPGHYLVAYASGTTAIALASPRSSCPTKATEGGGAEISAKSSANVPRFRQLQREAHRPHNLA
jgi:hypothetical protein